MKAPYKGANVLLYLNDRVDSARITAVHDDGTVSLVSFPSNQGSSNFQARHKVAYGPNQDGCWGWNDAREGESYIAAIAIAGHRVVVLDESNQLIYASNEVARHAYGPLYLSLNAANAGDSVAIARDGFIQELSWTWQPEQPIFLSSDGRLTQDYSLIRAGPGFLLTVAIALSETSILFTSKVAICLTSI